MAQQKVAFLGLGVMGYPMAGHLAKAGYNVCVYNRTATKADQWVEQHGGRSAATPAEAAAGAELVFACVGNDNDLRQICVGENGAFSAMRRATPTSTNGSSSVLAYGKSESRSPNRPGSRGRTA